MIPAQVKIVVFLVAVAFLAASVLVAVYYVEKEYIPTAEIEKEIEAIAVIPPNLPDPGKRDFDRALQLLGDGKLDQARDVLLDLTERFDDSERRDDAFRIVGEINMDQLLSRRPMVGKLDYQVRPGDALAAIARRNFTTMEYIRFVNGVQGTRIHPGDRLVLFPLEFDLRIDLGAGVVSLLRDDYFFKDYPIVEAALPPGVRVPSTMKVTSKSAWIGDERIPSTDPRFAGTTKWIQCSRGGATLGVVIAAAGGGEASRERLPNGIFLADEDVEELYTVLRVGRMVALKK